MHCDRVWRDARLATMREDMLGLGVIEDGVVAALGDRIVYAGSAAEAPALEPTETISCDGRWITPGLIDCHTHLVHAGNRAHEFELRLNGASYEEIARAGGGIISTVTATRAASEDELVADALPRLDALIAEGVTTIEIKSGYGLSREHELKQLHAACRLGEKRRISVSPTLLAAHALPPEFADDADGYIDEICANIIPAAVGVAEAVDAFCENIAFTPAQTERVFRAARGCGLPLKLHAEQLSNQNGAALAARYGALSADHLEYLDAAGISAMKRAGMVAVMLPGAYYFLRDTHLPPIAQLRDADVPMALATDYNPGTSPLTSLLLAMNMGATLFRLTPEECLLGVTRHAAQALGRGKDIGALEAGRRCDLAIWDIERPAELVYRMGFNPLHARVWGGE